MIEIRGFFFRRLLVIVVAAAIATAAGATQSRPVNLEEMTERASTIFSGRCLNVRVESDLKLRRDVTVATFQVERSIKGSPGRTITVRMPWASDTEVPAGVPSFARGDDVILFLYGESASGMRAPVGLGQGRFRIVIDKQGHRTAINDIGNRNLTKGLSAGARERLAEPLKPEALLDAVDGLLRGRP